MNEDTGQPITYADMEGIPWSALGDVRYSELRERVRVRGGDLFLDGVKIERAV